MAANSLLLSGYENQWVAISGNKVVAASKGLRGLYKKLEKIKDKKVALLRVLPFNVSHTFHGHQS